MNCYDYGTAVMMTAAFSDGSGNPLDPGTVTLRVLDPNGGEQVFTTGQLSRTAPGAYQYTIVPMVAGAWFYRFEGSGQCTATADSVFNVSDTPFTDAA